MVPRSCSHFPAAAPSGVQRSTAVNSRKVSLLTKNKNERRTRPVTRPDPTPNSLKSVHTPKSDPTTPMIHVASPPPRQVLHYTALCLLLCRFSFHSPQAARRPTRVEDWSTVQLRASAGHTYVSNIHSSPSHSVPLPSHSGTRHRWCARAVHVQGQWPQSRRFKTSNFATQLARACCANATQRSEHDVTEANLRTLAA